MAAPTVTDLAGLLGREVDSAQGAAALSIITAAAKAHTRGNGWTDGEPADEIRAVILLAAARLISNPRGLIYSESAGPEAFDVRSAFTGWTIVERMCLDRWRVKAI